MPRRKLDSPNYRLKSRGGVFYVTWTDQETSRSRAISTGERDVAAAEIWRDQWIVGQEQPLPPEEPRISAIVDGYVEARKGVVVAEGAATMKFAAAAIKRLVGNLEPHMLARDTFLKRRRADGVSDGTVARQSGVLRAALSWAVREKWIEKAPYLEMPPASAPRDRWLTHEEIDRLIEACATPHLRLFVTLAYHTAARRNAILELTWDQVDLDRGLIHYNKPGRRETKKRRATVPVEEDILVKLKDARKHAVTDHVIEFRGEPVASVRTAFDKACARAGIENCSPHVLRHTAATHMVIAGIPIEEIARYLGDRAEMVEKVYGKHSPDYLRRAAAALSRRPRPPIVSPT